jgi:1-acyl-sn-glycerol-3-phosphate acyltransferase
MKTLRSLVFYVYMYGFMAIMGTMGVPLLLGPRYWSRAWLRLYISITWFGLRWICGVSFEVRGQAHIPAGGALIASKHQSMWETLAFWSIVPDPAIILKRSLIYMPFFGWFALKLKNINVDRSAGAKALRKMLKDASMRAGEGRQILIFPEGTRVDPGENPTYKSGVVGLYQFMKVPCVPVALNSGVFLEPYCGLRRPGKIIVEFLEPIEPGLDKADFMERLHTSISTASDALLAESSDLNSGGEKA